MPDVESGAIDLFPEYTGSLLEYLDKNATATSPEDVYTALKEALPEGSPLSTTRRLPIRTRTRC